MTLLRPLIVTTVLAIGTPAMSITVGDRLSPQFYHATASSTSGQEWSYIAMYDSSSCDDDAPAATHTYPDGSCASEMSVCSTIDVNGTFYDPNNISANPLMYITGGCAADVDELVDSLYGDQTYIRTDYYSEENCQTLAAIDFILIDEACHASYASNETTQELHTISWRVFASDNGSITIQYFYNTGCSGDVEFVILYEREELTANECVNGTIVSTNAKAGDPAAQVKGVDGDDNSGVSAGTIAGIVVACIVAIGLV